MSNSTTRSTTRARRHAGADRLVRTRLLTVPHPILSRRAVRVARFDEQLAKTLARMGVVLLREDGIGIAAPQVGDLLRAVIAIDPATQRVYTLVNPRLLALGPERTLATEACLSLPGTWVRDVPRWRDVQVDYQDQRGVAHRLLAAGDFARVLQHECDHLDGVLITDLVPFSHRLSRPPQDWTLRG